mmetsp:Transcript_26417/g.76247  ORF Transcript_26417/g.76247 Transcript_26417/m.76247 type:complete len:201 (-) Transcript_26417:68-670(-)
MQPEGRRSGRRRRGGGGVVLGRVASRMVGSFGNVNVPAPRLLPTPSLLLGRSMVFFYCWDAIKVRDASKFGRQPVQRLLPIITGIVGVGVRVGIPNQSQLHPARPPEDARGDVSEISSPPLVVEGGNSQPVARFRQARDGGVDGGMMRRAVGHRHDDVRLGLEQSDEDLFARGVGRIGPGGQFGHGPPGGRGTDMDLKFA